MRADAGQGELKWLYEHVVERVPWLRRLPSRTSVLLQLLLMEALGLWLGRVFAVEPMALARGSLLILAVAIWSELLLTIAPRLRSPVVMTRDSAPGEGKEGTTQVLAAYRRWLFHPRHLEAVPGALMFAGFWIMVALPVDGKGSVLEDMLGRSASPLLLLPIVLLTWDVRYRLGVGLWVSGLSAWRSVALWRVPRERAELGLGRILPLLGMKWLRRMDRTMLLFPLTNVFVLVLLLPWAKPFYHLAGITAVTFGFGVVALWFDRAYMTAATRGPRDVPAHGGGRTTGPAARRYGLGPLRDGARVGIIGAGPAGSLCAHFLSQMAREEGRELHLTLFDYKDFSLSGPQGCNMCAGVVSGSLSRHLEEAGIRFPRDIVQSRIERYRIVTPAGEACLTPPAGAREIVTVFRGNGPQYAPVRGNVSFDDFLLENARSEGVEVVEEAVLGLHLPKRPGEPVVVSFGSQHDRQETEVEAAVGAFGLGGHMPEFLRGLGFGYCPPESLRACQAEVLVGADHISRVGAEQIVVFSLGLPGISFAAFTPKKEHFTVTLVGKTPVKIPDLVAFLRHPRVREFLPADWEPPTELCHCHPLVATKEARSPFTDRLVVIGDAAYSRYFKNGLDSAFHTAFFAADAMFHRGISLEAFRGHYYVPCRKMVIGDNRYGKLLFSLHEWVASSASVARAEVSLLKGESTAARLFQRAAWDLFTGDRPYRQVLGQLARPGLALHLLGLMGKRAWNAARRRAGGGSELRRRA